jgi:formylglycine-generating enzyme required for sulfatase activity
MDFVYIPPGCFKIGSPKTEAGHRQDETQTRVCVEGFWMGKTEVTNVQYQYKQSHDRGYDRHPDRNFNGENQSVVKVSRSQAHAYSQWLSQQTGENFRLPTKPNNPQQVGFRLVRVP